MTDMVSGAARRISAGELDLIQDMLNVVDEHGKAMDRKWGLGRLPALVSVEWAERFSSQKRKLSKAVWAWEAGGVKTHAEAMVRAYDKLDQLATEAGHQPVPPEQWEFAGPDCPIILVRDRNRMNQVETGGRRCQVWSLDEIEEVVRRHPELACGKYEFPGAEIVSIRPAQDIRNEMSDSLEGLPF